MKDVFAKVRALLFVGPLIVMIVTTALIAYLFAGQRGLEAVFSTRRLV
jgi:hypothetical protein